MSGTRLPLHRVTVTARRFRWLPWLAVTNTFEKATSCSHAEAMAEAARMYGGTVTVEHVNHEAEALGA